MHHTFPFAHAANRTARAIGDPLDFSLAPGVTGVWANIGPIFAFGDSWQPVTNTGTTIVTFLRRTTRPGGMSGDPVDNDARRSNRDSGVTALIEGFFAFVWFGWGQANASPGLSVALAAGSVMAIIIATLGAMRAFRSPAASATLHGRQAWLRYGTIVGVEFLLAGCGAAMLEASEQGAFVPVWVCAVVGVHFFALAPVLQDRLLVPLGALISAMAAAALVAGLRTELAPSTVTGVGAGTLLLGFAVPALLERQLSRPRQPRPDGERHSTA